VSVAEAKGVLLPFGDALAAVETVAYRTEDNCSSMLQDIQRGAPTEIDAICGAIIREAENLGMDAPVNRLLWQLVKAKVEL
jgi:2-dehydropantoate 2-reductase